MKTTLRVCGIAFCAVVAAGCGGPSERPAEPPAAAPASGAQPPAASRLIAADALNGCAGMTTDKAAAIVGATPADLTDYSRTEEKIRMCLFRNPNQRSQTVSFSLSHRESVERAIASMQSERETMGMAQGAIDSVTGTQSKKPAVEDVSGIGDESFYSPLNGAIMLRVANVIAQVTGPADMALKKRAAEEVARGLRQ